MAHPPMHEDIDTNGINRLQPVNSPAERPAISTIKPEESLPKKSEDGHHEHVEVTEDIEPELEALLHTDPVKGLTDAELKERLEKFGPNGTFCYHISSTGNGN